MPKHIGIVGVSPEGTSICYREVYRRASALLGDSGHPVVTIHNEPFEKYVAAVMRDDWHTVGELLQRSAKILAVAGAEFCITPDNLMQHGIHLAQVGSPIPWLSMTDLTADAVAADHRKVVGLVGTKIVMFGSTYQTTLGLKGVKVIVPSAPEAEAIDSIVLRELVHGQVHRKSRELLLTAINRLAERGAEAIILGWSEALLLLSQADLPLPAYDPTALLADGALRYSLGQEVMAAGR